MDVEPLFLATLEDLEERLHSPSSYRLVRTAGLLRHLLLDGGRLVDLVNREPQVRVRYLVNRRQPPAGAQFWSIEDGLDPDTALVRSRPVEVTLDDLLACPVMLVEGHLATVKDIIRQLAHISGGVHSGQPTTDVERALHTAERTIAIGGMPAGTRPVMAITRVVLKGLAPLRERVVATTGLPA